MTPERRLSDQANLIGPASATNVETAATAGTNRYIFCFMGNSSSWPPQ